MYQVTGNNKAEVTTLCAISAAGSLCHQCTSLQENGSKLTPWLGVYPTATLGNHRRGGSQQSFVIRGFHQVCTSCSFPHIASWCSFVPYWCQHFEIPQRESYFAILSSVAFLTHYTATRYFFLWPLKTAWKKAVLKYTLNNISKSVVRYSFAQVFKEAWRNTVQLSKL